jgi:TolB protein
MSRRRCKMKKRKMASIAAVLTVLLAFTACGTQQDGDRTVVKEPGKNITIIENDNNEAGPVQISVEKIDQYEGLEITDWLDEQTVVLSKENRELGKMYLTEVGELYPRSLYLYDLDTKEYKTLVAQKNMFLWGAVFSPDKKHLLYHEFTIGDTSHYLMNLDDGDQPPVPEGSLGIAITAEWADAQAVIGVSYAGGAYMADSSGRITQISGLQEEQLFTVQKMQNKIYYVTTATEDSPSSQLYMLDLTTGEKKDLKVENADRVIPSPDGTKILILQWTGTTKKLHLADTEGNILKTVAEGTDVTGVSWSPDQRMIAYRLESVANGTVSSGLYLFDVLAGESVQIAVDTGYAETSWSPSGKKIAVAEPVGKGYNSSIIHLK